MITRAPTCATALGLVIHRRLPSILEVLGIVVLLAGVLFAIGVFSRSARHA